MVYQVFRDSSNQYRWRLVAANHRSIAVSGEGYYNRQDCVNAILLVKGSSGAPIVDV